MQHGIYMRGILYSKVQKFQNGKTFYEDEDYYYEHRPEAVYRLVDGKWNIKTPKTNGKFVEIKDESGKRSAEIERKAIIRDEYLNKQRIQNNTYISEIKDSKSPTFYLEDKRTVRATSNKPINPNIDLMHGNYNRIVAARINEIARKQGVDPATALAVALQESHFGKLDANIGQVNGEIDNPYVYLSVLKNKLKLAEKAGAPNEATALQYYNGLGKLFKDTEANYRGYNAGKYYGVSVPAAGLDLKQNPLYGKQIIDLRENVIKKNPYLDSLINNLIK